MIYSYITTPDKDLVEVELLFLPLTRQIHPLNAFNYKKINLFIKPQEKCFLGKLSKIRFYSAQFRVFYFPFLQL